MTTTTEKPTLEEVICWLNAWANGHTVHSRERRKGYDQACSDIFDVLATMVGEDEWLETWRSRSWERLRASNQDSRDES